MNETLARFLFLPVHERIRGRDTIAAFRRLKNGDAITADNLNALRVAKLRNLITHAVDWVPYYQRTINKLGSERWLKTLEIDALAELPTLSREDIRKAGTDLLAKNLKRKAIKYSTGGSTGEPLVFFTDAHKESEHNAHKLRCRSWFGIEPGSRQLDIWGSPIELERMTGFRKWKDEKLLNQVVLSAFHLTETRLRKYAEEINHFRPRLVYGYPSAITLLAHYLQDNPGKLDFHPELVSCTSEMLFEHQREAIRLAFGCPVANEYGARDGGMIAHECPNGSMHIAAEQVIVEIEAPDEMGVGELLITNLDNFSMPLIRYRIGDRGALSTEPCGCGRPSPVLSKLAGRTNDFLLGEGGRKVHSLAPIYVLRPYGHKLKRFRIVQDSLDHLAIDLVSREPFAEHEIDDIRRGIQTALGFEISIDFTFPENIPTEGRTAKFQSIVCQVDCC